ncbi:MAG: hypothetical protein LBM07_06570 [Culturomica sp.]|jgi:leucyl aminopeptidase|nr:hypothetical protein [Culturomica sp.]
MKNIKESDSDIIQLPKSVEEDLFDLFKEYNNKLQPSISVVEALRGEFPGQVLNEIRACFGHIARCFMVGRDESDCNNDLKQAHNHITRAILDCYKIMLIYYFDEVKQFEKQYENTNLIIVDNGHFLPEFTELKQTAESKSQQAKLAEADSFSEKEKSYPAYKEAILAYRDVLKLIENSAQGLAHANQLARKRSKEENRRSLAFAIIGAILGAIISLIIG